MLTRLTQWTQSFRSRTDGSGERGSDTLYELGHARSALLHCVRDCPEGGVKHLQHKIRYARTHRELWSLRSEAYHCVAIHHQAMATERVQSLSHHFEGWVDSAAMRQKPR
jgi:hypothetical protein